MDNYSPTTGTEAPNTHVQDVSPKDSTLIGIGFAWELGYTIAVPAVLFGFIGRFADKAWNTPPLFMFVGIAIAFVTSAIIVVRRLRDILNRLPKVIPKKKDPIDVEAAKEQELLHDLFRPPTE
ncbi:MAG TPA: AtpZ/AtpI family protein [Candidatus Peribacteria bacterium]|nr:AtpZ/AtpI family protein [Candidatus Peribacteria bacterium]